MEKAQQIPHTEYVTVLWNILQQNQDLIRILSFLRDNVPDAYLCAGAIRNTVWSALHGFSAPAYTDMDVIFYDAADTENIRVAQLQILLAQHFPACHWDVVNQALVHTWYRTSEGKCIQPYRSVSDAVSVWPETATAVAVQLISDDQIHIVAPLGLQDLFELKLRWNSKMVAHHVFLQRLQQKQWLNTWNRLEIVQ